MHYDERYQQILSAGARIFAEKGFHHASMRDMSREIGMSLAGLYYYFHSKEELLFLIQKDIFETILDGLAERLADVGDPVKQMEILITTHVTYCTSQMDRMKVLSHESDSLEGEYWEEIRILKRRYYRTVRDILLGIRERGELADIDAHVATMALFGMVNWIYTWYRPDGPLDPSEVAGNFCRLYFRGILGAAGDPGA